MQISSAFILTIIIYTGLLLLLDTNIVTQDQVKEKGKRIVHLVLQGSSPDLQPGKQSLMCNFQNFTGK